MSGVDVEGSEELLRGVVVMGDEGLGRFGRMFWVFYKDL